jgi:hypothetical protein
MTHPLAPDLSQLSQEELASKYNDLMSRMNQAYRIGPVGMIPQMQMLLQDYREELGRRQQQQLEEMEKTGSSFKNIIDIK